MNNFCERLLNRRGATLIELMVVIMIIGILANIVAVQFGHSLIKVRDARRRADVRAIVQSINTYYTTNGTFAITGGGDSGTGVGWLSYSGGTYPASISSVLQSGGYVASDTIDDPILSNRPNYLYWCCGTGCTAGFSIFVTLEEPRQSDIDRATAACGSALFGPLSAYAKNYAVP